MPGDEDDRAATGDDLSRAVHEMLDEAQSMTRSLLGSGEGAGTPTGISLSS